MPKIGMIKSVIREYGPVWLMNRSLYSLKLRLMGAVPLTERWYEKKTAYPKRLGLFHIDVDALCGFIRGELSDEDKHRLIDVADKACAGVITAFSSIALDYGQPIDWQMNPLTGKRCDERLKWYKIPDFDRERGDIKVIWEASRFSHFIVFARAYLLTGDRKYYDAFSAQLGSWLKSNPYGYGANFKCGQECSLRMVNALLSYTVFLNCGVATDADTNNVKDLVDRCYRKVLSNFYYAYKCIRNNHTISELMGIIVGAWCCDDQRRLDRAYDWLDKVIAEQFTVDGGYRQFSFNYQRLALQDLEAVMSVSDAVGRKLNRYSIDRIRNAAKLMYQCQDASGDMPNYGSNDGALVFPVTSCGYRDYRPVINTAYALACGSQCYGDGKHQEELIWFSGGRKLGDYGSEAVERISSQFADAGLFTIRGQNSWAMIVANDYRSRPGHMDQLHLDLWVNGINVLCDAGIYSYASDEGRLLAANESHNTASVDGVKQMNSSGAFMVYDWTKRQLGELEENIFEGSIKSVNGYNHSRTVKRDGRIYEITDRVDRDYIIHFHTPCDVTLDGNKAILSMDGRNLCEIASHGEMALLNAYRSLYYLRKEEIRVVSISGRASEAIKTTVIT